MLFNHVEGEGGHALKVLRLAHNVVEADGGVCADESVQAGAAGRCYARQMANLKIGYIFWAHENSISMSYTFTD